MAPATARLLNTGFRGSIGTPRSFPDTTQTLISLTSILMAESREDRDQNKVFYPCWIPAEKAGFASATNQSRGVGPASLAELLFLLAGPGSCSPNSVRSLGPVTAAR